MHSYEYPDLEIFHWYIYIYIFFPREMCNFVKIILMAKILIAVSHFLAASHGKEKFCLRMKEVYVAAQLLTDICQTISPVHSIRCLSAYNKLRTTSVFCYWRPQTASYHISHQYLKMEILYACVCGLSHLYPFSLHKTAFFLT